MMPSRQTAPAPRARRGVSLVEILVSMTILAVVLSLVGRLSFTLSDYNRTNDLKTKRTFAMQQQMNFIGSLPYASVTTTLLPSSKTFTTGDFTYKRRVTITAGYNVKTIAVTVVPSTAFAKDTLLKESMTLIRTNPPCGTVLLTC